MEEDLITKAFQKAVDKRNPTEGLIVYSDRGEQYVAANFTNLLLKYQCQQSMSRADAPYDKVFAISYYIDRIDQSFFSRFKAELLEEGAFLNLEDAHTEIFEFIEIYYNLL
jgi:transposase InsO family protein